MTNGHKNGPRARPAVGGFAPFDRKRPSIHEPILRRSAMENWQTDITEAETRLIILLRKKRAAERAYQEAVQAHVDAEDRVDETLDLLNETRAAYSAAVKEMGG